MIYISFLSSLENIQEMGESISGWLLNVSNLACKYQTESRGFYKKMVYKDMGMKHCPHIAVFNQGAHRWIDG